MMQKAITADKKLEEKDKIIEKKDKLLGKKDKKLCVQERRKEKKIAETVRIPHHAWAAQNRTKLVTRIVSPYFLPQWN